MVDIIFILLIHWIADFCLQTRFQGNNKSRSLKALLGHTTVYSLCWLLLWPILGTKTLWFMLITFVLHTITDFITSRVNAYLWLKRMFYSAKENPFDQKKASDYEHLFWIGIGGDQFLHATQLIITYTWL